MKKTNKKGFTLAELLIVVAIIGVLIAVAIPVFTSKLDNAKLNTDKANLRSAYAEAVSEYMQTSTVPRDVTVANITYTVSGADGDHMSVSFNGDAGQQYTGSGSAESYGYTGFTFAS